MPQPTLDAMRDFAELVSLGAFLTMIALVAHAFGA
jgi:hypothetical protein